MSREAGGGKAKVPRKPVGRPANTDSAVTRQALIRAAASRLSTVGYERMTLDEVATAAGITRGAIYRYFDSKQDLARAAVLESSRPPNAADQHYAELCVGAKNLNERLRAFVMACTQTSLEDPEPTLGHYELGRLASQDPELAKVFGQRSLFVRDRVTALVQDAIDGGELDAEQDHSIIIEGISGLIWAMTQGAATAPTARVRSQLLLATDALLMNPPWLPQPQAPAVAPKKSRKA
ncbi:MAG: TetR/AcrR family transcriptional regulator [Actinomycetota bacterium]|nr:TetR/AcrR family transcriptional regulator [Actinomycetota bacterium]MDP2289332.1 TetR/AcrR family transcriptional regulator [Actinomycetota bacterium]